MVFLMLYSYTNVKIKKQTYLSKINNFFLFKLVYMYYFISQIIYTK